MSERKDILDGTDALYKDRGLVYTCHLGWLDLGHMDPRSTRPHTGASALWKEIKAGGPDVLSCLGTHPQICASPANKGNYRPVTLPDNKSKGFKLIYKQDMQKRKFGVTVSSGVTKEYIVRQNLSHTELKSVALAIFMEVSLEFEDYQNFFPKYLTDSGFSQEDLVSNLIGFHIAVGSITKAEVLALARPVSKETALAIWDRNGSVGSNKNRGFKPLYTPDTWAIKTTACTDECAGIVPRAPDFLEKIKPAKKGVLFMDKVIGNF